jgi:PPOX class probable F420-dependent enzyme
MTPAEVRARFKTARVARLATVGPNGAPHLVPVTFAVDGDRIVTAVDAKPKRSRRLRRLANIVANPQVCLLVDGYDDDWSQLWWARADGEARILEPGPGEERATQLLRARHPQYATVALSGPVIAVEVRRWSGWSAYSSAPAQPASSTSTDSSASSSDSSRR